MHNQAQEPGGPVSPRVFISYAGADHTAAARLAGDLKSHGIRTFFAPEDIDPGANFVARISKALEESDYYLLLISANSLNRPWVEEEWTAALARELHERRAFLFLLRIDDSPPPGLLAARVYLNAFDDWDGSIERLVATWSRDRKRRAENIRVYPAPCTAMSPAESTVGIYVFNKAFSVELFMRVPPRLTGRELTARMRALLDLKESVQAMGGKIGLRFSYRLLKDGMLLFEKGLAKDEQHELHEGETLDLEIAVEQFAPGGETGRVVYRGADGTEEQAFYKQLLDRAFFNFLPPAR